MSNNAKRTVWLVVAALFAIVGLASLASGRSSGLLCFVVCAWAASRVHEAGLRSTAPETSPSPVSLSPASSPRKDTAKPKLDQTQPDGRPSPSGDAPKAVRFAVDAKLKKQVARRQFLGSTAGKAIIACAAACLAAGIGLIAASFAASDAFIHDQLNYLWYEIDEGRTTMRVLSSAPLTLAFLLPVCGYRQITASTAQRRLESLRIEGGRLVHEFKMSNDARPHGMNVVSIGLASCNVSVKNEIAVFSGDVQGAYITDWHEGAVVPLDKLGPMTKPLKLGLYFEPDVIEAIRPHVAKIEGC